jgi:bacillithiol biosynthesis deacetylase BshB1
MVKILIVGPHPDDQELGMGGTIAKLTSQGHDVLLLDVTSGEPTPFGSPEVRANESAAAAEILGVKRTTINLPNRFVEHTIPARHAVAAVIREHQAEIIFAPYFEDAHPDHVATSRIVEDARFDAKITTIDIAGEPIYPKWLYYYYATHLRIIPNPSFLIDTTGFAEQKRASIVAYESQFILPEKNRPIVGWVEAQDKYFGGRLRTETAEPFYSREPIGLDGISGLL